MLQLVYAWKLAKGHIHDLETHSHCTCTWSNSQRLQLQSQAAAARPEMSMLFPESPQALAAEAFSPDKRPRPAVSPRKKAVDGPTSDASGQLDDTVLRSLVLSPLELESAIKKRTQACVLRRLVHSLKVSIVEFHCEAWSWIFAALI